MYKFVLGLALSFFLCTAPGAQPDLAGVFRDPPPEARPRGYWLWAHGNFDYAAIRKELREFKRMGLGGVDIYDMGVQDPFDVIPAGNPFLGKKMLDGIEYALEEAEKLDLAMGLSVSNGWNAGAEWTTPDEMIMRLLFWTDTIGGPALIREIGFPGVPTTFEKLYGTFELYPRFNEEGFPLFYEDVALMAYPSGSDGLISNPDDILNFDTERIEGNRIALRIPEGEWILTRAVVCPLFQRMWMRSDQSDGFIMDHYSKKATRHHFEEVIGRLESRLGDLGETALERLYLASFEAEDYIIWSPALKETFSDMHGYRIDPYIPAFTGMIVESEETTRRFLHDYRRTVSEMFVNNHYRQAREICHQHDVLLASESGGPGPPLHYVPTEDLKALGSVDIMRGEFWNREPQYFDEHGNDITQVVKNIGSAAHIYGRKIVEMEAFTSHRKHWQERPVELKKIADRAFCEGMTRVVYHTMPHSPQEAGQPGWSYQAGTHISPKMTWWDLSKPFHDYLARTSAMLQQGLYVADVAYYYGEEIPKFASGTKYIRKSLGREYAYDDLNREILLQADVGPDGSIILPSGMQYRLLVLTDPSMMSLAVARKIEELVSKGATVLGDPPATVPGLMEYKRREAELSDIVASLWPGSTVKAAKLGPGRVYVGAEEKDILAGMGVAPDFQYQSPAGKPARLDFIHRATNEEDLYFIRNMDSAYVEVMVDFRIGDRQPWIFCPKNGGFRRAVVYTVSVSGTRMPLSLEPYGSVFVVFSGRLDDEPTVTGLSRNGSLLYPPAGQLTEGVFQDAEDRRRLCTDEEGSYRLEFSDGRTSELRVEQIPDPLPLKGPWEVYFEHGWEFEPIQQLERLIDWREHPEPGIRAYSGQASYHTSFNISQEMMDGRYRHLLDLGNVGDAARVFLNGMEIGTIVFPPYRFDISHALREGENHLSIEVANTWLNRLIRDSKLPFDEQKTRSNVGSGDRANPVRHWDHAEPLPSGLIGPASVIACRNSVLN